MGLGKSIRMARLFAHSSGRFCSVAVDHYIGYGDGLPLPLRRLGQTLTAVVAGRPDAITMHKGVAETFWADWAGKVPFILQTIIARPDDSAWEQVASVEEALRLGADAVATAAFIHGGTEGRQLRLIADIVREAGRYDLPVIAHIYPRKTRHDEAGESGFTSGDAISHAPEDVAWAAHCAVEIGADIIKVPYCGERSAFSDIVSEVARPVVVAGGPKAPTLRDALAMTDDAVAAGARGATIGRNIWGSGHTTAALQAFKYVVHDRRTPQQALEAAGLAL